MKIITIMKKTTHRIHGYEKDNSKSNNNCPAVFFAIIHFDVRT